MLGRSAASMTRNCWCYGTRSPCCAAPVPGHAVLGELTRPGRHVSGAAVRRILCSGRYRPLPTTWAAHGASSSPLAPRRAVD